MQTPREWYHPEIGLRTAWIHSFTAFDWYCQSRGALAPVEATG